MSTDKNYYFVFIVFFIIVAVIVLLNNKKFLRFCKLQEVKEPICIKKVPEILQTSTEQLLTSSPVVPVKEECMLLHAEVPCFGVKINETMPKMSCGEMHESAVRVNYDT